MSEAGPVVTDSGPLIALATVGLMDLVGKLYGSVLVPGAVFQEVAHFGRTRPGGAELATASWAERVDLDAPPDVLLAQELGPGEAEAISLAALRGARLLLLDDRRARRIAEVAYGLRVKGAAGVLVSSKQAGLIPSVRSPLDAIRSEGYFLAQSVIDAALREAGEA